MPTANTTLSSSIYIIKTFCNCANWLPYLFASMYFYCLIECIGSLCKFWKYFDILIISSLIMITKIVNTFVYMMNSNCFFLFPNDIVKVCISPYTDYNNCPSVILFDKIHSTYLNQSLVFWTHYKIHIRINITINSI